MLSIIVLIIYIIGLTERTHLKEHLISFNIKIIQPDHITCGPTCVQMLVHHYGNNDITLQEIKQHTKTVWFSYQGTEFGMTSPNYISVALNKFGISNRIRRGNLDILKHYVSLDSPCITLVRSNEYTWHYVIVTGFTETQIHVYDPNGTSYTLTKERFLSSWNC